MNITCDTKILSEACQNVQRAVSSKSTIPSLEGILIRAEQDKIFLSGYDLEVGISTQIDATVAEEGSIILNARLLCDILRKLPHGLLSFQTDERFVATLVSGEAEFSILGLASAEYPELPSVSGGSPLQMDAELLKNMVRQTLFCVANAEINPVHSGIKFEIGFQQIRLIGVDGYRLAMRTETLNYEEESLSFVVPGKTLSEVLRINATDGEMVTLHIGQRHIIFEIAGYSIISRLLEGEFLDYRAAIPQGSTAVVKLKSRELTETVERTSLIITDRLKSPLRCIFNGDIVRISCTTALGRAQDKVPAEMEGERVEIGFNHRYLLDALHATETDLIRIELNGSLSPMKILPPEGESFLFMILPVRLKND